MADQEIALRIIVENPPVRFAVQRGKDQLLEAVEASAKKLVFEFSVRAREGADGAPNFLGRFAQGPVGGRFVYVNSGKHAGEPDCEWTRRAKVPLGGITWAMIRKGGVIEARIGGTARDGGPACATVPLLGGGWKIAQ
ncbi:MAG TPA: DUF5990 family protein [Thermoanaerobaculia bacterium]|jgi:hypothetical protein|nr:DUF5990 family protein [Thermoanaerobaculia bacterium]